MTISKMYTWKEREGIQYVLDEKSSPASKLGRQVLNLRIYSRLG